MITPAYLIRNQKYANKNYYIFDLDFSEYLMEQGIQEHNEIWGFLEDYLKEECNGK